MAGSPVSLIRADGPRLSASAYGRAIELNDGDDLALAIAALNPTASSPAVILMPPGTYTHTSAAIAVPSGLTLKGLGGNVNVTAAFTVTGQTGVVFEGFTLTPATVAGTKLPAIEFVSGASSVTIRDMTITGGTMPFNTEVIKRYVGALALTFEGDNLVTGVPNVLTPTLIALIGGTYNQRGTLTVGTYDTNKDDYAILFIRAAAINFTGKLVTYGTIGFNEISPAAARAEFNSVQVHLAGAVAGQPPIQLYQPMANLTLHFGVINTTRTNVAAAAVGIISGSTTLGAISGINPAITNLTTLANGLGAACVVSAGTVIARPIAGAPPYTSVGWGGVDGSTNIVTGTINVQEMTPVQAP